MTFHVRHDTSTRVLDAHSIEEAHELGRMFTGPYTITKDGEEVERVEQPDYSRLDPKPGSVRFYYGR